MRYVYAPFVKENFYDDTILLDISEIEWYYVKNSVTKYAKLEAATLAYYDYIDLGDE